MKLFSLATLLFLICLMACQSNSSPAEADAATEDESSVLESTPVYPYLVMISETTETGDEVFGYASPSGDVVVPMGKYPTILTDTLRNFGIVMSKEGKMIAIDPAGNELYEVYVYDNGPDYLSDGLFRIIKDGKIGYADESGQIVIPPQYACTYPFENGKAKVALNCELIEDGEYTRMESEEWFYINTKGEKIEE